jgi:thiol-disulfide isomerase/thioredoxin
VLTISNDNGVVKEIKGDTKGHFEASFEAKEGMYFLSDGVEYAQLYLKGGDDLQMKMDAKRFDETITFSGKGAAENNFLAGRTLQEQGFKYDSLLALDEKEFNQAVEAKSAKDLAVIDNSILHPTFKDLQKTGIMEQVKAMKQYYLEKKSKLKLNNTLSVSFDYENYKGGKSKLEDFKGKYVYIDVWATWCGPCVQEIPYLKEIEKKYHKKNIAFISISIDGVKDFKNWKSFVKNNKMGGIQLFATKNATDRFIKTYQIVDIPRFILIDPKGKIIDADAYRPSSPQLIKVLDKYLK